MFAEVRRVPPNILPSDNESGGVWKMNSRHWTEERHRTLPSPHHSFWDCFLIYITHIIYYIYVIYYIILYISYNIIYIIYYNIHYILYICIYLFVQVLTFIKFSLSSQSNYAVNFTSNPRRWKEGNWDQNTQTATLWKKRSCYSLGD